ncbi:hypothetical protein L3Y34_012845 [Caenorhabditis briggsae]|uniref:Uncharacterized protein n=1 Tax=Caenorhabditis briggsae TaxID=6238 RepID=A0AAE8ZZQ0_CAEBR|nr:hypothetical protein L3Y34_012845 [Caenorhabditis briggsae]
MATFMIEYVTRFKVRFEAVIVKHQQDPLSNGVLNELQLTRARRVVNAANVLLAMGPDAIRIDHKKFEAWRTILLMNNVSYNKTEREIRGNGSNEPVLPLQPPPKPMRRR